MGSLEEYREKRDFRSTPEPSGDGEDLPDAPVFVVQKHDASSLHYDLRLQVDDALSSWAVPKVPSTDPDVQRLAIRTEDHPLEYATFEGVIPEDEYGAGTVLVWDRGSYRNLREEKDDEDVSMEESLRDGKVEVALEGEKLEGGYTLVRTESNDDEQDQWLLIKTEDEHADARRNPTSTEPDSVVSGRSLEDVAREEGSDS